MTDSTIIDCRFEYRLPALVALVLCTLGLGACAHIDEDERDETAIVVPSAATTAPQYSGDGSMPADRPVIRMSDGQRDWEVEVPETARGYQMRIPLNQQRDMHPDHHALTQADRELIEHLRRTDSDFERQGLYVDDEHATDREARRQEGEEFDDPEATDDADAPEATDDSDESEADPAPTRPSYFRGIDDVQTLFEAGYYEQAMIHLADLEQAYPNDERLLSMKGTLWLELGREALAREAWEQVLQINPDNEPVQRALRRLDGDVDDDIDEDTALDELEQQL